MWHTEIVEVYAETRPVPAASLSTADYAFHDCDGCIRAVMAHLQFDAFLTTPSAL